MAETPEGDIGAEATDAALSLPATEPKANGASPAVSLENSRQVRLGTHVVLRDCEGTRKVAYLQPNCKELKMGRYPPIPVEVCLGLKYGVTLNYEDGQWSRLRRQVETVTAQAAAAASDEYETNQHLAQDGSAQTLTPSEIKAMKASASSGKEVLEALVSNSATFSTKTKFAQEKYLKKKAARHLQQVKFMRPTLMELSETYLQQFRSKACGLRFDYLSSLLCQVDAQSGRRFLVLDSACSLVVAGMAQQMNGEGKVFRAFRSGCSEKALTELDLGKRRHVVRPIPLDVIASDDPMAHEWVRPPPEAPANDTTPTPEDIGKLQARQDRIKQRQVDVAALQAAPMDGLVAVAGEDDAELLAEFLETGMSRLAYGGRLIVYGQQLQPIAARQGVLRASGCFVDVKMHQLHSREYQVLPQRTHPIMTADAMLCEGFLLMATKVMPDAEGAVQAVADDQGGDKGKGKRRRMRR